MKKCIRNLAVVTVAAVLWEELRKPTQERDWHGRVLGFLPYDFRCRSAEDLRAAYWDPNNNNLVTDRVFGIGWAINFGALAKRAGLLPSAEDDASQ